MQNSSTQRFLRCCFFSFYRCLEKWKKEKKKGDISDNLMFSKTRGKLILDRTTKAPKLNLRNWECGVLVPVFGTTLPATSSSSFSLFSSHEPVSVSGEAGESGSETGPEDEDDEEGTLLKEDKLRERELRQTEREIQRSEPVGMEVFDGVVPVPMETPGKKIAFGRRPWFYSEG